LREAYIYIYIYIERESFTYIKCSAESARRRPESPDPAPGRLSDCCHGPLRLRCGSTVSAAGPALSLLQPCPALVRVLCQMRRPTVVWASFAAFGERLLSCELLPKAASEARRTRRLQLLETGRRAVA